MKPNRNPSAGTKADSTTNDDVTTSSQTIAKPNVGSSASRSLSEILKDADAAIELQSLINLWNELAENKYKYTLVQIRFASEYISELALKSKGEDFEKGKFYMTLRKMLSNEVVS